MVGRNGQALTELRRRFKAWRSRRPKIRRIPEDLWQAAVHAAREHGVCRTAREVGVDYYSLKNRLAGAPKGGDTDFVEFMEIPQRVFAPGPGCIVELQDAKGMRLRVELRDAAGVEVLAGALWSRRG